MNGEGVRVEVGFTCFIGGIWRTCICSDKCFKSLLYQDIDIPLNTLCSYMNGIIRSSAFSKNRAISCLNCYLNAEELFPSFPL